MYITNFLALLLPIVAASPAGRKPIDECEAVNVIVDVLRLNQATPFCSNFLSIKTSTATAFSTVTSTSTQHVNGPTITATTYSPPVTATDVVGETLLTTTTVTGSALSTISGVTTLTSTILTTTTVYYSIGVNGRKRSPEPVTKVPCVKRGPTLPPYVASFASSAISAACSCLSIPTPVTTTTLPAPATAVATSTAAPVTVIVSLGTTTTLTSTSQATSTSTVFSTTTSLTTQFSTVIASTTSTVTASRLAVCSPGPAALYNQPLGFPSRPDLDSSQHPTQLPDVQSCCEACYGRQDCVAASYLASQGTCFFAIATDNAGTSPAPPQLQSRCPLGIGGNGVTDHGQGSWFPGPCVN